MFYLGFPIDFPLPRFAVLPVDPAEPCLSVDDGEGRPGQQRYSLRRGSVSVSVGV